MHLEKCKICGQQGYLDVPGARLRYRTTDGYGQFYGQLLHVMAGFICSPEIHCDRHISVRPEERDGRRFMVGNVHWDYRGYSVHWKLAHDTTVRDGWHEDFNVILDVKDETEKDTVYQSFLLPFRDLCYAVTKCGTEVLKQYGIIGYTQLAEEFEDLNMREFLELKAFALDIEEEVGHVFPTRARSSLEKEIELLLFDM